MVALVAGACGGGGGKHAGLAAAKATSTTGASTTTVAVAVASDTSTTVAAGVTTVAGRVTTTARPAAQTAATNPPATNPPATAAPTTAPAGGAITIQSSTFMPAVLDVAVGTKVTATNKDSFAHTWTSDGMQWNSNNLGQNQSFSYTFTAPGTYAYHCNIHASMHGTVRVT